MYDKGKVIALIVIFLALLFYPIYYNLGKAEERKHGIMPEPSIETPAIQQMKVKQCVKPRQYMRESHMQLLDRWRDLALRENDREIGVIDGVRYERSLQNTCMHCHSNKREFCDRCHIYSDVKVYCWDCHIAP
jgi:hypothetical protein